MCAIKTLASTSLYKTLRYRCFPVNLAKFLKKSFSAEDIWSIAPVHHQKRRFLDIYKNILLIKK